MSNIAPEIPFSPFPKISRWSREVVVTEKIDGTNAQIYIDDTGTNVYAGSRNRWLTLESDNFGFARWVHENRDELLKLGPGQHFGEWWGAGIQRRYGLDHKRFSLFNTARWSDPATRPSCCHVVPVLFQGNMDELEPAAVVRDLATYGSRAAPGFMQPEGIVIYCVAGGQLFKKTLERDESPKGQVAA